MMIRALGVALLVSGLALAQDSEPKPPPEFAALDAAFERAAARDTRVAILSHSEHDGLAVAPIVRWWRRAKLGEVPLRCATSTSPCRARATARPSAGGRRRR